MGTPGMWQGQPNWPPAGGFGDPAAQYPPQYQPMPPPMPRPSPLAVVPRGDLLLDAACALAVIVVLVLPWNVVSRGFSRVEVIVSLVLVLVALGLPYLSRMNLFGPGWGPAQVRITKILLAAPLALCAAGYFVADAVLGTIAGQATQYATASGAWLGLATAALAAAPRRSDLIDPAAPTSSRLWATLSSLVGVLMVAVAALSVAVVAVGVYRERAATIELRALVIWPAAQAILLGLWVLALFLVIRRATRGDESARLVVGAAGAGALVWTLLNGFVAFSAGGVESVLLPYSAVALTMVAAVVAGSPSLAVAQARSDAQVWFTAAAGCCRLIVVANVLLLAQVVIAVLLTGALSAVVFTTAVCAGLGAVAADWARQSVTLGAVSARTPILAAAGVQALGGVILMVVTGQSSNSWEAVTAPQLIATVALSTAAAAFVLLPTPVRALFPSRTAPPGYPVAPQGFGVPPAQDYPAQNYPAQGYPTPDTVAQPDLSAPTVYTPTQPGAPTVYDPVGPLSPTAVSPTPASDAGITTPVPSLQKNDGPKPTERAADPGTPAQDLWELARSDQSVWPFLAANPAAPPDLLAWLGQSTDPAVRASLRARGL